MIDSLTSSNSALMNQCRCNQFADVSAVFQFFPVAYIHDSRLCNVNIEYILFLQYFTV